jgi:hypothetical protein
MALLGTPPVLMKLFRVINLGSLFTSCVMAFTLKSRKSVPGKKDPNSPVFLFDLDGTLYSDDGVRHSNRHEILLKCLQTHKGLSCLEAESRLKQICEEFPYVPELGLVRREGVNWSVLEKLINDELNVYEHLKPDKDLQGFFSLMTVPKYVFTNSGMYLKSDYVIMF